MGIWADRNSHILEFLGLTSPPIGFEILTFVDLHTDTNFFFYMHQYQYKVLKSTNSRKGIPILRAVRNPQIYELLAYYETCS